MKVAVVGASGHTGRFVVEEIARRGLDPVAVVRDEQRLRERGIDPRQVETRLTSLEDPSMLDRALSGVSAVVNCAGPFLDTSQAVIDAALRSGLHYFDVTAEQGSARNTFDAYDVAAQQRGVVIVPAAGFYGALADLLATAALGDWTDVTEIRTAVALNRWWPTRGTRKTGERNTLPRLAVRNGELSQIGSPESITWTFPQPFSTQTVVELPFTETILMARHLNASEIRHFLSESPLKDVRDTTTSAPIAVDELGRSAQTFLMESIVSNGTQTRRLIARGGDIYAITAPIVVEAVERVLRGDVQNAGAFAPAQIFESLEFLQTLAAHGVAISEN